MSDLLETISAIFSRGLSGHLAARLGEGDKGVKRALQGVVPVPLGGLIVKIAAGDTQLVFEWSQQAFRGSHKNLAGITGLLVLLGSGQTDDSPMGQSKTLLTALFGSSEQAVANAVSYHAQI